MKNKNILRKIYLYLFSTVGLVLSSIGMIMFLHAIMDEYIMPDKMPPRANIIMQKEGDEGEKYTLNASNSRDVDGHIVAYEWRVNDNTISTESKFTYDFQKKGPNFVVLKVTDNEGYTGVDSREFCIKGENNSCNESIDERRMWNQFYNDDNEWEINEFRRQIKLSLSFLLVGIPLFLFHWGKIRKEEL